MFNLQLHTATEKKAVAGKKIVYLYRTYSKASTDDGWILAFTTENGRTISSDSDSTATKDGSVVTPGTPEVEITTTSLMNANDTRIEELEQAIEGNKLMEIWEANLEKPATTSGKYKGKYFQGYLSELEISSNAEDMVEVSSTFAINGTGATGDVTVSQEAIDEAQYAFRDIQKTGA